MIFFPLILRELEGERGVKERNIHVRDIDWLPPAHTPTRASIKPAIQVHALDLDQESNWQLFSAWAKALIIELHRQG